MISMSHLLIDRLDMPPCGLGVADPDLFVTQTEREGVRARE
jgi:hypothetical protein